MKWRERPGEVHDESSLQGILLRAGHKGVCLTPWGERKMFERAKHGPLTNLFINVELNMMWINTGRGMIYVRWGGDRTSVVGMEAKF